MMKRVIVPRSNNHHNNNNSHHSPTSLPRRLAAPPHVPPATSLLVNKSTFPFWAKMIALLLVLYLIIAASFILYVTQGKFGSHPPPPLFVSSSVSSTSKRRRSSRADMPPFIDTSFHFDKSLAEQALITFGPQALRRIITAYIEPPMNDTIPNTGSLGDPNVERDHGIPPQFMTPLPRRTMTPNDLISYSYPQLQTCHDVPGKIPIDRGLHQYENSNHHNKKSRRQEAELSFWNIGDTPTPPDYIWQEAKYCPVDADPFLPWIHDLFPSPNGTTLHVIAQNKRRCKTGRNFQKDLVRLAPQVALLQAVSVQRMNEHEARTLAPDLWYPSEDETADNTTLDTNDTTIITKTTTQLPRYRLAPHEEASEDGMWTRFICRFHATDVVVVTAGGATTTPITSRVIGETLSVYPFNYELVSYRKAKPTLMTPKGKDTHLFWTSHLHFECPIPPMLQPLVASGETVLSDGTPTLYVDVIPIRTPPRYGIRQAYLTEELIGPKSTWNMPKSDWPLLLNESTTNSISGEATSQVGFDAQRAWGEAHVLPRVEASGRWTNLPICQPPQPAIETAIGTTTTTATTAAKSKKGSDQILLPTTIALPPPPVAMSRQAQQQQQQVASTTTRSGKKPHLLSICIWTSATFYTRGKRRATTDTRERLLEWITFHLMVGFDHIYLYDNSGAHTNETDLRPIVDLFPASQVTRIDWPSVVCNNNIPAHDNTGERSSQYAAENSCLTRFGPFTEWMASIDADEYLVPMGKYKSLRQVVQDADKKGYNILSFKSTRGRLRFDHSTESGQGREKKLSTPFLKAYNCDSSGYPKPEWADRAKKQLYRTDYVLYHFVHYSTVTKGLIQTYKELGSKFQVNYRERGEHYVDERKEAVMVHTKTTSVIDSKNWVNRCHYKFEKKWRGCYVGFPWPKGKADKKNTYNKDGFDYNCFINENVENHWVPELKKALKRFRSSLFIGGE